METGMLIGNQLLEERDFEKLNVLVVDDNQHMIVLLKTILHSFGVRNVRASMDGADAFKELRCFAADVVICDWNMAPLDGMDFVRLVRTAKDSPNRHVSVIMLTGHTEMGRVMEARDAGVNEFLAKPISPKGLRSRLTEVLLNPRPFIKTATYFGPDRRRGNGLVPYSGPERRKAEAPSQPETGADASTPGLTANQIDALMAE